MNLPVKLKHVMILTGELSGDFHAARLVDNIRHLNPQIYFSGIGGPNLQHQKVDLFFDINQLSAMGVTEVLMQFGSIKHAYNLYRQKLKTQPPDLLILVDYPGFNLKAAQFAKEHYNTKILYYITPKVWAWKKSRLKQIKKYVDHAALILPFEEKIFKTAKIPSTYVGNPLIDEYPEYISKPFLYSKNALLSEKKEFTIGLLPGSRKAEINNLLNIMIQTGEQISQKFEKIQFLISKSDTISKEHIQRFINPNINQKAFKIYQGPVKDIFSQSDLIIAASGTVILEAALCCVPTILIYKVSPISYKIIKFFVKLKYVGLPNLIVNKEVIPEFLQNDATVKKISNKAIEMLNDLPYFQSQLQMVRNFLGKKGASMRTAIIAINLLRND